jgi:predicted aminopeptidase
MMKFREKNLLSNRWLIISCLLVLWLPGCYLLKQGKGQIDLRCAQIPISEAVKQEPNPEYRQLLKEIPEIKKFAETRLLLNKSDNFTGYYKTEESGVSYVVTASSKTALKAFTWWFPIIGSVPYKGYFNKADALQLKADLKSKGYDTYLFAAPAYSTLGWFRDPVTTPMIRRGRYNLVSTIIHEMTHETLFVPGAEAFNEQLAMFVERIGSLQYFKEIKGFNQKQLTLLDERVKESGAFAEIVRRSIPEFEELYDKNLSKNDVLIEREKLFDKLKTRISQEIPGLPAKAYEFNNARLMQYRRYSPESPVLENIWISSGKDWKRFWTGVRKYVEQMQRLDKANENKTVGEVENISNSE